MFWVENTLRVTTLLCHERPRGEKMSKILFPGEIASGYESRPEICQHQANTQPVVTGRVPAKTLHRNIAKRKIEPFMKPDQAEI